MTKVDYRKNWVFYQKLHLLPWRGLYYLRWGIKIEPRSENNIIQYFPLPHSFYNRPTLTVARELLGAHLIHQLNDDQRLIGKIVETEAYIGEDDPACHAARGRTNRTEIMYGPPGYAYIYFIYGMYYCLNAVTEREGFPAAVLIRAVEPLEGTEQMRRLRHNAAFHQLSNGPGKLCQAFALDKSLNGIDLCGKELFITAGNPVADSEIETTSRIGIREGKEHAWRFCINDNPFVSRHFY